MINYSPPIQSPLVRKFLNGEITFTVEISPPVSGSGVEMLDQVSQLKPFIDAVNITDGAGATVAA